MKVCGGCLEEKPNSEFSRARRNSSGLYHMCKPCKRAYERARLTPEGRRNKNLKAAYGLTADQFKAMEDRQEGVCAICQSPPDMDAMGRDQLQVDHDHETGKIRGLLCGACNRGLANFRDDSKRLLRAIVYIEGEF